MPIIASMTPMIICTVRKVTFFTSLDPTNEPIKAKKMANSTSTQISPLIWVKLAV